MDTQSKLKKVFDNIRILIQSNSYELIDETHWLLLELGCRVDSNGRFTWYSIFVYGLGFFEIRLKEKTNMHKVWLKSYSQLIAKTKPSLAVNNSLVDKRKGLAHNIRVLKDNGYKLIKIKHDSYHSDIVGIGPNMEYVYIEPSNHEYDEIESITCFDWGSFAINFRNRTFISNVKNG